MKAVLEASGEGASKEVIENRSSISVTRMSNDNPEQPHRDCDYCKATNKDRKEEDRTDEVYAMGGFSTGKFRMDEFQHALDMGACRSGDFIYFRNQRMSCCEVWSYRVKIADYKLRNQQSKAMRRFQRYLRQGPTESQKEKEFLQISRYLNKVYEQFIEAVDKALTKKFRKLAHE